MTADRLAGVDRELRRRSGAFRMPVINSDRDGAGKEPVATRRPDRWRSRGRPRGCHAGAGPGSRAPPSSTPSSCGPSRGSPPPSSGCPRTPPAPRRCAPARERGSRRRAAAWKGAAARCGELTALLQLRPLCEASSSSWREAGCASLRARFSAAETTLTTTVPREIRTGLATMRVRGVDARLLDAALALLARGDVKGAALAYDAAVRTAEGTCIARCSGSRVARSLRPAVRWS
jgi:hypothetical protein